MAIIGTSWLADRGAPAAALSLPVISGLAYLAAFGAPIAFVLVNAFAQAIGLLWISFGRLPQSRSAHRVLALFLLVLLALPIALGPSLDGVTRWLSIGGVTLHVGMLAVPLLVRLLASDPSFGAWATSLAILIGFAQPDSATVLALASAALGVGVATRNTVFLAVSGLGLAASLGASFNGDLPPQSFVENILTDLWPSYPLVAIALATSLLVSLLLVFRLQSLSKVERFAIGGTLSGFIIAALLGNYPYPLIGYGAAPVLGLGLALATMGNQAEEKTDGTMA